jgi:hypothetical protein
MADIIVLADARKAREIARDRDQLEALRVLNPWLWLAILMGRYT